MLTARSRIAAQPVSRTQQAEPCCRTASFKPVAGSIPTFPGGGTTVSDDREWNTTAQSAPCGWRALTVVGLDNIEVSGEATGLPEIIAVNVGALTAGSATASAVTKAAEAVAQRDRQPVVREVPSIITSRLLGFGDE